ncbi:MAG: iron ABC transporter permease [Armatimonadetes bacterium]|nr:iron ABC transporter permease [Armatimonadota bacterium]
MTPAPTSSEESQPFASKKRHPYLSLMILVFLLVGAVLVNIGSGDAMVSEKISPGTVLQVIRLHLPFLSSHTPPLPVESSADSIVWELRTPGAVGGVLVGALLAMAGVAFQSFLQNPLADPYMVGVSSGAALGSVLVILMGGTGLLLGWAQPIAAFATGLLATAIVYFLAQKQGRLSSQTFLLAGIVVGTFFWSFVPLAISLGNRSGNLDRQSAILSRLLGSLQSITWSHVVLLAVFGGIGGLMLWTGANELDMMAFGEESAAHLGVNVEGFKRRIILAGALVTAAAVSVAGIIAFVGLVVPHIARRIVGPDHRVLLPTSFLFGGLVLTSADWLSRVYLAQLEVGVITSLIGAPIFCYLLRRGLN